MAGPFLHHLVPLFPVRRRLLRSSTSFFQAEVIEVLPSRWGQYFGALDATGDRLSNWLHAVRTETLNERIDQGRAAFNVIVILRGRPKVPGEGWS